MNAKERLERYLTEHGVPYQLQHHRRAVTTREVSACEHIDAERVAKVVMVVADRELVMLVLPATQKAFLPQVARVLGAGKARLAEEWEFALRFFDCEIGAMPPFGNLYGVPTFLDSTLAAEETIYFQACTHTDSISVRTEDLIKLTKPSVAAFSMEEALVSR
jgi:Ala-tRNA(Pro) deacylase